jgi:putative transposase
VPRLPRAVLVGNPHHITQRGVDRQRVFFTNGDYLTYLDCLTTHAAHARLRILAYCLMTNHIHLVAIPEEATSLGVAMRHAHSRYAAYINARRRRVGHLWQNRFYSCALDEPHLWTAVRYVERNPVRANLVERPEQYEWSSAAAHLEIRPAQTVLDIEFAKAAGGAVRWAELLAEPEELLAIRTLQRGTFSGRPVGDESFIKDMERKLGRSLTPRKGFRSDLLAHNVAAG